MNKKTRQKRNETKRNETKRNETKRNETKRNETKRNEMNDVMLAMNYKKQNPCGWWMSEKLDGVRAIWNGKHFVSRNGNIFYAPEEFTKDLPQDIPLDGELWEDRGLFQSTVGKVRSKRDDWSAMKFMVFDVVNMYPFEQRQCELRLLDLPSQCKMVEQVLCTGEKHLREYEQIILEQHGEGVMLRKAGSFYEGKRSQSLLKVKKFKSDEAIITDYEAGKGRHQGRLGALVCEYMGKTFKVGSGLSDQVREFPPKIGSIVTFNYFEKTNAGVPRFPTFQAVRDYE